MKAPFACVVNRNSEDVSVIDTATNQVVATVPIGGRLQPGVASPDGKHVYVPDSCNDMIWLINTASNESPRAGIQVGRAPQSIAVSPDGKTGYVTNMSAGTVSVIDTAKNAVVSTIQVGPFPTGVTFAGEGKRAYVTRANGGDGSGGPGVGAVVVVDTANQSIVDTITLPEFSALFGMPSAIAITPDGKQVYLSDGSAINVFDTASNKIVERVFPKIDTRGNQVVVFDGMAITPDGKFLYATAIRFSNPVQSFVWAIDTTTNTVVLPELWSGTPGIAGLAVTPDGKSVYVATQRTEVFFDSVLVIDATTNKVATTVGVRARPVGVAMAQPS